MRQVRAKFPTPPDPAATPATKQPVSQHFSASINGVEVFAEAEYALDAEPVLFPVPDEGGEVAALFRYKDASGLFSGFKVSSLTVPPLPDVTPPDVPEPIVLELVEEPTPA